MIPKIIHYVWFSNNKNKMLEKCLKSWKKYLPEYKIIRWDESNFDITTAPDYVKRAYTQKKWAFVADYVRLWAVYTMWGVYLDSDVEVIKSFDPLLETELFMWYTGETYIEAAVIGSSKNHFFIKQLLEYYQRALPNDPCIAPECGYIIIPQLITKLYSELSSEDKKSIQLYSPEYFYPFSYQDTFTPQCITPQTYAIHYWSFSWGSPLYKVLVGIQRKNKTIFQSIVSIAPFFRKIQSFLKKIFS